MEQGNIPGSWHMVFNACQLRVLDVYLVASALLNHDRSGSRPRWQQLPAAPQHLPSAALPTFGLHTTPPHHEFPSLNFLESDDLEGFSDTARQVRPCTLNHGDRRESTKCSRPAKAQCPSTNPYRGGIRGLCTIILSAMLGHGS